MNSHKMLSAMTQILQNIGRWPGVTLNAHRYGGLGIFVECQELGQLHDCGLLDVSLTAVDRNALLKEGQVHRHHTFPDSSWITLPINGLMVPLATEVLGMAHAHVLDAVFSGQIIMASVLPRSYGLYENRHRSPEGTGRLI